MNKDKFAEYYAPPQKQQELSEYVHQNHKIIMTKMLSEMRRMLDIEPEMTNKDGYLSLMVSLEGRMFNEIVYSLCGLCQSINMKASDIIPISTLDILLSLLKGINPLKGKIRCDVKDDKEKFKEAYLECIDELRAIKEALPKEKDK